MSVVRIPIRLTDEAARVVQDLESRTGDPARVIIEQGISLRQFVRSHLLEGSIFLIQKVDGSLEQVHFRFDGDE